MIVQAPALPYFAGRLAVTANVWLQIDQWQKSIIMMT